jgi:integrase/recombinase XerC
MIYEGQDNVAPLSYSDPSKLRQGPMVTLICHCGCGTIFERPKGQVRAGPRHYFSQKHRGAHRTRVYLEEMCGSFLSVVTEYLEFSSIQKYKDIAGRRCAVCPFMLFLNERGITDLERVTPKTVTQFLSWAEDLGCESAKSDVSVLVGFFKWAIQFGYRKSPCPVIPSFHRRKQPSHLPRPYSADEMAFIWETAIARGNSRTRAIVAIGEESGLRIAEICRLRSEDVDMRGRRLFVRLPNKGDCERWAPFHDKTSHYIAEWLLDRQSDCGHTNLFHNSLNATLLPGTAHREMCVTFCKMYGGKVLHLDGLEQWSTHRLRHTMASNLCLGGADVPTIMAAGGWKSTSSMLIYTKVDQALARRGYDDAMHLADERAASPSTTTILSLDEFLAAHEDGANKT